MPHRFQVKQKLGTYIDIENNFQVPNCEGAVSVLDFVSSAQIPVLATDIGRSEIQQETGASFKF